MDYCKRCYDRDDSRMYESSMKEMHKAKIKCLCCKEILSSNICSEKVEAKHIVADKEYVNDVCAGHIKSNMFESQSVNTIDLCAQNARINDLCVNNLMVGNSSTKKCEKWRAAVTFASNMVYNLGSPINWNVAMDDPNSNVSFTPFSYTVPESGYYSLDFHLDTDSLQGPTVIAGSPISNQTVYRNNVEIIDSQSQFLTFNNGQSSNLSGLIILNAGDIITMSYEVLVIDPILGLMPYPGTITIEGDGTLSGKSFFTIHYLSSLECGSGVTCQPCQPVGEPCQPVSVDCENACFPENRQCNFRE